MTKIKNLLVVGAAVLSLAAAGCEDDDDTTTNNNNAETGDSGTGKNDAGTHAGDDSGAGHDNDAGANNNGDAATNADAAAANGDAGAAPDLTDPQVAAVTSTANAGEIAQASAAQPKLQKAEIKAFAQQMIDMHTAAQNRQQALLTQKGITPQENPASMQLRTESDAIVAQLSAASAQDVDRLYIEAQVTVHDKVLNMLDTVLIPTTEDAALKADLTTARGEVAAHLNEARQLRDAL